MFFCRRRLVNPLGVQRWRGGNINRVDFWISQKLLIAAKFQTGKFTRKLFSLRGITAADARELRAVREL